jgi:hypothetical protein
MYGFHPETTYEVAVAQTNELRRNARERRSVRRAPLKARHFLGAIFVR